MNTHYSYRTLAYICVLQYCQLTCTYIITYVQVGNFEIVLVVNYSKVKAKRH